MNETERMSRSYMDPRRETYSISFAAINFEFIVSLKLMQFQLKIKHYEIGANVDFLKLITSIELNFIDFDLHSHLA